VEAFDSRNDSLTKMIGTTVTATSKFCFDEAMKLMALRGYETSGKGKQWGKNSQLCQNYHHYRGVRDCHRFGMTSGIHATTIQRVVLWEPQTTFTITKMV
jgi:hypothetical protein